MDNQLPPQIVSMSVVELKMVDILLGVGTRGTSLVDVDGPLRKV